MIHEIVDTTHWKLTYPLSQLDDKEAGQEIGMISTVSDIAIVEQLRDEAFTQIGGFERIPTDVFIWHPGEPKRREVTKIGGLPYRDARRAWPIAPSGAAMNFMAQICFADSRDLFPVLPGDTLLIFAEGREWQINSETRYDIQWGAELVFEWVTLGDFPLVASTDLPTSPWQVLPCYGVIHRTWDYRDFDASTDYNSAGDVLSITEATKIGGLCPWIDEPDYCRFGSETGTPGTYLCTLGSVSPEIYNDYSTAGGPNQTGCTCWKERQSAILNDWEMSRSQVLTIADVGLLNFFIDHSGSVRWTGHCQT